MGCEMRHLDLFSGIGGFSLAASWVWGEDHNVVCFCEQDKFCQKILNKHWPGTPIVEDVRDVESIGSYARGTVDLISAGVPCQPASVAGKQSGTKDDRWLWPQTFDVVREIRPRWCLFENVRGLLSLEGGMVFKSLLSELEAIGYEVWCFVLPACAKNAPHRRDRVWIVGRADDVDNGKRTGHMEQSRAITPQQDSNGKKNGLPEPSSQDVANTSNQRPQRHEQRGASGERTRSSRPVAECCEDGTDVADAEKQHGDVCNDNGKSRPRQVSKLGNSNEKNGTERSRRKPQRRLGRITHGLPKRLDNPWGPGWEDGTPRVITGQKDRVNRLKALGNSIVPQVAYEIMMGIKESDETPRVV